MLKNSKKAISGGLWVMIGTTVASLFSYFFNIMVGRKLGPSAYADFTSLMSLLVILSVGSGTVLTITMAFTSRYYAEKNYHAIKDLFVYLLKFTGILVLILTGIGIIFVPQINQFLNISNSYATIITLFGIIFGIIIFINRGILQGMQQFKKIGWLNPLEMISRLLLGLALISLGANLIGALGAVVFSTLIIFVISLISIYRILHQKSRGIEKTKTIDFRKALNQYFWPTLISNTLLVIVINSDVIIVKHYFNADIAGAYAALSTIAKIIFYAASPIINVMFPMIAERTTKGEKHYRLLLFGFLATLFISLAINGIYAVFPGTIIEILFGSNYTAYFQLLPMVSIFIMLYTLANLLINYYMAIKNFKFLYVFAICFIFAGIAVYLNHSSLETIIKIYIASMSLLLTGLMGYYIFLKWQQIANYLGVKSHEN